MGGLYVLIKRTKISSSSKMLIMTELGSERGWVRLFQMACVRWSTFLVYAMALHCSSGLCQGIWVSHMSLKGRPHWGSPSGLVSEQRVAIIPVHGSCISRMLKCVLPWRRVEMHSFDQCAFTDFTQMGCSDIFKVILLNVVNPGHI